METKLRYDWSQGKGAHESDIASSSGIRRDISSMVARGCRVKKLKLKIKELDSSVGLL